MLTEIIFFLLKLLFDYIYTDVLKYVEHARLRSRVVRNVHMRNGIFAHVQLRSSVVRTVLMRNEHIQKRSTLLMYEYAVS